MYNSTLKKMLEIIEQPLIKTPIQVNEKNK